MAHHQEHSLLKGATFMSIGFILMAGFGALLKVTAALSSHLFAVWLAFGTAFLIQFLIGITQTHRQTLISQLNEDISYFSKDLNPSLGKEGNN